MEETSKLPIKRSASDSSNLEPEGSPPKRAKGDPTIHEIREAPVVEKEVEKNDSQSKGAPAIAGDGEAKRRSDSLRQRRSRSLPSSQQTPAPPYNGKQALTSSSQPQGTGQNSISNLPEGLNRGHSESKPSGPSVPWILELPKIQEPQSRGHVAHSDCRHTHALSDHQEAHTEEPTVTMDTPQTTMTQAISTSTSTPVTSDIPLPSTSESKPTSCVGLDPRQPQAAPQRLPRTNKEGLHTAEVVEGQPIDPPQPPVKPVEPASKEASPTPSLLFSSDEEEETTQQMLSTQMNKQIDRVQIFLKMDRLKRPRNTKPNGK